ncbi:MAG: hypothetical protein JWP61_2712 [Friedmanniella sp.]|nr:hypothetical protein [Friedmanniella sp.]
MIPTSAPSPTRGAPTSTLMPAAALDELDQAVSAAGESWERARVVRALLQELYASMAWLDHSDEATEELRSLREVLAAADSHEARQGTERQRSEAPQQLHPQDAVGAPQPHSAAS